MANRIAVACLFACLFAGPALAGVYIGNPKLKADTLDGAPLGVELVAGELRTCSGGAWVLTPDELDELSDGLAVEVPDADWCAVHLEPAASADEEIVLDEDGSTLTGASLLRPWRITVFDLP